MSPIALGYRDGWTTAEPLSSDPQYLRAWNDAHADRLSYEGRFVKPSLSKTKPKPSEDSKMTVRLKRPAPPGSRAGYKATSKFRGASAPWSDGKGPQP